MDEILLWPVLKGLSVTGNFSCVISAKFEIPAYKTESTQRVQIVTDKPIILWIPEAGAHAFGMITIGIDACRDEVGSRVRLHAFPHFFQISVRESTAYSQEGSASALVRWGSENEAPLDPGPRHLQFILSTRVPSLSVPRSCTNNVTSQAITESKHISGLSGSFGVARLLLLCVLLAVGKIFVVKLIRTLKPAYETIQSHFDMRV